MRVSTGDASGAVADLGILVPLVAALVLVNGLRVGSILVAAGALVLGAGVGFRLPFPVQPLKALTALAVAEALPAEVIHAAGLQIGFVLVFLAVTGLADRLAKVFTKPVIRSLQFAVGTLLIVAAVRLAADPPAVFAASPSRPVTLVLAALTLVAVGLAAWRRWYTAGAAILAAGVVATWVATSPDFGPFRPQLPLLVAPDFGVFVTAFVLLVIPQIPLTYGNAVVGVTDLAREHFGPRASRVTEGRVAASSGLANIASALIGGMPMCHGSSGLSAHIRLGASTAAMSVMLGGAFLLLGLVFPGQVLTLFALLPVWVLAGFLAYAGVRHAMLVLDLRGARLALALAAGAVGIATGNLAYTTAVALVVEHGPRLTRQPAYAAES